MKIVVVADIHSNLPALEALPERSFDQLWLIGDLVGYGPNPREVIDWARSKGVVAVRGNHDHAVAFSCDVRCSGFFKVLAEQTLQVTCDLCMDEGLNYLRSLPVYREITIGSTKFYLVHAMPTDPFSGNCPEGSPAWRAQVECIEADLLVVGHTHRPFLQREGGTTILNPGSLGQPRTGRAFASYAVWEDGNISLREYEYPVWDTVQRIRRMPIPIAEQDDLIAVLKTGDLPIRVAHNQGIDSAN